MKKLSNGLTVVVSEDHSAPTFGVCVSYGIGFRLEPEGRTWFALVSSIILAMGVFQYFTLDPWAGESDVTATAQSVIMLVAYLLILVPLALAAWAGRPPLDETPIGTDSEPPPGWTGLLASLWWRWQGERPPLAHGRKPKSA